MNPFFTMKILRYKTLSIFRKKLAQFVQQRFLQQLKQIQSSFSDTIFTMILLAILKKHLASCLSLWKDLVACHLIYHLYNQVKDIRRCMHAFVGLGTLLEDHTSRQRSYLHLRIVSLQSKCLRTCSCHLQKFGLTPLERVFIMVSFYSNAELMHKLGKQLELSYHA